MDKFFRVEVITATPNPQQAIYAALSQDYAEDYVYDNRDNWPIESECGRIAVQRLLKGHRGHYGCLEHPSIVFNAGWFPHSTMQQLRTHRVGVSFDVSSFRYTGERIGDVACHKRQVEEVFYLRPIGSYSDRQGKRYEYTANQREEDIAYCFTAARLYARRTQQDGFSEEHARSLIPFDVRQNWVVSTNVRSLMHVLDLRAKADAQLECQQFCDLVWPHFERWVPEIAAWYKENRWKKARLAP